MALRCRDRINDVEQGSARSITYCIRTQTPRRFIGTPHWYKSAQSFRPHFLLFILKYNDANNLKYLWHKFWDFARKCIESNAINWEGKMSRNEFIALTDYVDRINHVCVAYNLEWFDVEGIALSVGVLILRCWYRLCFIVVNTFGTDMTSALVGAAFCKD